MNYYQHIKITGSIDVSTGINTGEFRGAGITGSLFGTASYALTASYVENALTASFVTASDVWGPHGTSSIESASYAQTASYVENAQTASFVTASNVWGPYGSGSIASASWAETASYFYASGSTGIVVTYASGGILITNNAQGFPYTGSAEITGSLKVIGPTVITGSLHVTNNITADTITVRELHVTTETSSVLYSSGSTRFGDTLDDTHQFTGSILVTGSLESANITGSLLGTASWAQNSTTASFVTASNVWGPYGSGSIVSASWAETASYFYVTSSTGITVTYASGGVFIGNNAEGFPYTGSAEITGSLKVIGPTQLTGSLFVSGNIVANTITAKELHVTYETASVLYSSGSTKFGDTLDDTHEFTGSVTITGSLQSANITGSLLGTASWANMAETASYVKLYGQNITINYVSGNIELTGSVDAFPYTGSARISGSMTINGIGTPNALVISGSTLLSGSTVLSGSMEVVSGSITGSLFGTASYATTASYFYVTSSKGIIVNYVPSGGIEISSSAEGFPFTGSAEISGSLMVHGYLGLGISGSYATTGSWRFNVTGSELAIEYWDVSASAWYTDTIFTGTPIMTGALPVASASYAYSASYANLASRSYHSRTATTASYAHTASYAFFTPTATSASYAETASYAVTSSWNTSGSYSITASHAVTALTASYAKTASIAEFALNAGNATVTVSGSAPSGSVSSGSIWWNKEDGNLYIQVTEPTGSVWVPAVNSVAGSTFGATYREAYSGSTWTVNHSLGTKTPIIQVYSGSSVMVPESIIATNNNQSVIKFASIVSGSVVASSGVGGATSSSFALNAVTASVATTLVNFSDWSTPETITIAGVTTAPTKGTIVYDYIKARQVGVGCYEVSMNFAQSTAGTTGNGHYLFSLPTGITWGSGVLLDTSNTLEDWINKTLPGTGILMQTANLMVACLVLPYSSTQFRLIVRNTSDNISPMGSGWFPLSADGTSIKINFYTK